MGDREDVVECEKGRMQLSEREKNERQNKTERG